MDRDSGFERVQGGPGKNTTPPPNRTDRDIGAAVGTGTQGVDGAEKSKMGQ